MMNPNKYKRQYYMPPAGYHGVGDKGICGESSDLVQC